MMYIFTAHDKKRGLLLQKYVLSLESFEAIIIYANNLQYK